MQSARSAQGTLTSSNRIWLASAPPGRAMGEAPTATIEESIGQKGGLGAPMALSRPASWAARAWSAQFREGRRPRLLPLTEPPWPS